MAEKPAAASNSTPVSINSKTRLVGDANRDGILTREEFTAAQEKYFNAMDANSDGQVTVEEKAAYDAARAERRAAQSQPAQADKDKKSFLQRFFN